jgi:hypothetical protein
VAEAIPVYIHLLRAQDLIDGDYARPLPRQLRQLVQHDAADRRLGLGMARFATVDEYIAALPEPLGEVAGRVEARHVGVLARRVDRRPVRAAGDLR